MKVTFVIPYAGLQGGIKVVAIYAERLKQRGHEVAVISTPRNIPFRRKLKSFILGRGWPGTKPEPSYFKGSVQPRVLERVRPVVDADVPDSDVVVATWWETAEGVKRLSRAKGAKAIFIQNYEVEEGKHNLALDATWLMPLHKITISQWLVELARDRFNDAVVSHVPNSVDLKQFDAAPRLKQPVPTVGLLYSKPWFKGYRTSLAALELVKARFPSLRLISFGMEHPGVISLRLPPNTEFHFRPAQEEIKNLYAQCDVWLCGSNREGFHLPPLEAMACRCPVVSTQVGGPMDVIEEGVNGHLVKIGDWQGLADRTLSVLNLPELEWKRMSDAAYATATHYSWDDATDLFEKALEFALERDRRGDWRSKEHSAAGDRNQAFRQMSGVIG